MFVKWISEFSDHLKAWLWKVHIMRWELRFKRCQRILEASDAFDFGYRWVIQWFWGVTYRCRSPRLLFRRLQCRLDRWRWARLLGWRIMKSEVVWDRLKYLCRLWKCWSYLYFWARCGKSTWLFQESGFGCFAWSGQSETICFIIFL
jgi:hypothetical protein